MWFKFRDTPSEIVIVHCIISECIVVCFMWHHVDHLIEKLFIVSVWTVQTEQRINSIQNNEVVPTHVHHAIKALVTLKMEVVGLSEYWCISSAHNAHW